MEKQGIIITVLIGVIVGLIIAICNNWTEWWQIILCVLSATCALFVLLGILWFIAVLSSCIWQKSGGKSMEMSSLMALSVHYTIQKSLF